MAKNSSGFGTIGSTISFAKVEALRVVALRGEAARRRTAIEVQARKSRRNLQNPESFAWCAERTAE